MKNRQIHLLYIVLCRACFAVCRSGKALFSPILKRLRKRKGEEPLPQEEEVVSEITILQSEKENKNLRMNEKYPPLTGREYGIGYWIYL